MRSCMMAVMLLLVIQMMPLQTSATGVTEIEAGPLFTTFSINASGTATNTYSLDSEDLPVLAEVYTATWCENCVKAEHALDDIEDEEDIVQIHFHPEVDGQDPFGTAVGDDWWERRNGARQAPCVVIHGDSRHLGSAPRLHDSLEEDYTDSASKVPEWGEGILNWTWVASQTGGDLSWNMEGSNAFPDSTELGFYAFITEESAHFPDGSNGLEYYPHILRDIISLGSDPVGEQEIVLPEAHDGDDLRVQLVIEVIENVEEEDDSVKEESLLPFGLQVNGGLGIGIGAFLITALSIILFRRKRGSARAVAHEPVNLQSIDVTSRSQQQLDYEAQMVQMGWDPVKAREYADSQFGIN